jgi:hypothetical protein
MCALNTTSLLYLLTGKESICVSSSSTVEQVRPRVQPEHCTRLYTVTHAPYVQEHAQELA